MVKIASSVSREVETILSMQPAPIAVGLGGSMATGRDDELSDIDMILVFSDIDLTSTIAALPRELDRLGYPHSPTYLGFWRGYSTITPSGLIEFFITSPSILPLTPMARRLVPLHDPDGVLARWLGDAQVKFSPGNTVALRANLREGVVDAYMCALLLRKSYVRKDLSEVLHLLEQLRSSMISIVSAAKTGEYWTPYGGARDVYRLHGPAYFNRVVESYPSSIPESIAESLRRTWRLLSDHSVSPAVMEADHELWGRLASLVEDIAMGLAGDGARLTYWQHD